MALESHALTTPDALRDELQLVPASLSDPRAQRLINAASEALSRAANSRRFERAVDVVEDVKGYGTAIITLERAPVVSVTSVQLLNSDGTVEKTYDPSEYRVEHAGAGILAHRSCWPNTATRGSGIRGEPVSGTEARRIRVTYTAGWITPWQADALYPGGALGTRNLPYDLEMAAIQAATFFYRNNASGAASNVKSEKLGSASVTYFSLSEQTQDAGASNLPPSAAKVAARYWRDVA